MRFSRIAFAVVLVWAPVFYFTFRRCPTSSVVVVADTSPIVHSVTSTSQVSAPVRSEGFNLMNSTNPVLIDLAQMRQPELKKRVRDNLIAGTKQVCASKLCVFDNIEPFLTVPPSMVRTANSSEGGKTMIDPDKIFAHLVTPCVVYGLGIATDSTFEQAMSHHCEVHAFDCTISPQSAAVHNMSFNFHQICLGSRTNIAESVYNKREGETNLVFQSLEETMNLLGHSKVDVLKFDIEGSEWSLFESILKTPPSHLPTQMFFEIHTETANPIVVPVSTVKGRTRPEVNKLFLTLLDLGYWVYSKIINDYDAACAEFSVVRLPSVV